MSRQLVTIKGDTMPITFTFTDSTGAAINLTGATVKFTVKKSWRDPDSKAIIAKSWTSHTNAAGGITDLTLTKDDTFKQEGNYQWDVQITGSGGAISTADMGEFIIKPHITVTT